MRYIAVERDDAAPAPVRGRLARRPAPVHIHPPARGAAGARRDRHRDHRPALLDRHAADRRVREAQPAAARVARSGPLGRPRRPPTIAGRSSRSSCRSSGCPGGARAACADQRRALARARRRRRARPSARRSTSWSSAAGPPASAPPSTAPRRGSTRSSSRAPRSAARPARRGGSRTTSASRRGISGTELTSRAVTQARKFGARMATPVPRGGARARRRSGTSSGSREDHEVAARAVVLATGAEYRRLPVEGLEEYEGISVFYAAGPPEAQRCGANARRRRRRRQLRRPGRRLAGPRRRARDAAAPPRRPERDDVALPDRRARALRRRAFATAARSPSCTAPRASSRR